MLKDKAHKILYVYDLLVNKSHETIKTNNIIVSILSNLPTLSAPESYKYKPLYFVKALNNFLKHTSIVVSTSITSNSSEEWIFWGLASAADMQVQHASISSSRTLYEIKTK